MTSRLKSKSSGISTLFRKGLAANRRDTKETKKKTEELQVTKKYYRSTQSAAKELAKAGQTLGEAESTMGSLLRQFVAEGVSDTERSKDLQQLCDGFSDRLKKLSSLRNQVNDRLETSYVSRTQKLLDDDELARARAARQLPAELEYQLARRDLDGADMVREMSYSYLCYFETGAALMREMESKMKTLETKYAQHPPLNRKDFIAAAKTNGQAPPDLGSKLFEVPLSHILERPDEPGPIPAIMDEILQFIESNYMTREGIFRVPGATSEVNKLRERIDAGQRVDFENEPIINKEHTICAVVKGFFRDLPEPLLTFQKFDEFVFAAKMSNKEEQKAQLIGLVKSLPEANFNLLGRLMQLFKAIVDNEEKTKMNSRNIAISFGMNLMRMQVEDPLKLATSATAINKTCELLIDYCSELFPERIKLNDAQSEVLSDGSGPSPRTTPPSDMPPEWQEHFDESTQKFYYHHSTTGETSWTKPSPRQNGSDAATSSTTPGDLVSEKATGVPDGDSS